MQTKDGKISGELLKRAYYSHKDLATNSFNKLTNIHFEYDTFDKMRVYLAVQILSESVASSLEYLLRSGFFKTKTDQKTVQNTITFVRTMNILFDMMNAKSSDDCNENKRGISGMNVDRLTEIYEYLTSIELNDGTVYWIEGIKQTINGTLGLFTENHSKNVNFILLTRYMNQDPLENLFGRVRAHGKNNRNPYLIDFLRIISRIITSNILITPSKTNCELDESSNVTVIDWDDFELPEQDKEPVY